MSNLNILPEQWLKEQFQFHFCDECNRDADDHTAVPVNGNWFARCDHPLPEEPEQSKETLGGNFPGTERNKNE